jgi:hypothetical protein
MRSFVIFGADSGIVMVGEIDACAGTVTPPRSAATETASGAKNLRFLITNSPNAALSLSSEFITSMEGLWLSASLLGGDGNSIMYGVLGIAI